MTLKLKYFVPFDQLMGKAEVLQLERGTTVKDLLTALAARYPGFSQGSAGYLLFLRNGVICSPGDRLLEGDEISILVPQSGG